MSIEDVDCVEYAYEEEHRRDLGMECYLFDALSHNRQIAATALEKLSGEQLSATLRFLLWLSNSSPSERAIQQRMEVLVGGDTQFAAAIRDAMLATKGASLLAAND